MGLTVRAKGLSDENSFDCGYITFGQFRIGLAKAYNPEFGDLYERWYHWYHSEEFSSADFNRMGRLCGSGIGHFLFLSDCDGKLTPQECRAIYNDIKDLHMEMEGHNYGIMKPYNMLEHWKAMFKHCAKRRVNMYFT